MKTRVIKSDSIATLTDDPDLTLDGHLPHQCEAILGNGRRCRMRLVSKTNDGHWYCRHHRPPRGVRAAYGWKELVWALLTRLEQLEPETIKRASVDPEFKRLADVLL